MKNGLIIMLSAAITVSGFRTIKAATPVETGVCIFIVVTVTATAAWVGIECCQPSFRCTSDPENPGTNWCSTMTRTAARNSGLVQAGPNYRTYAGCMKICATNSAASDNLEVAPELVVEKSTDLLTWTVCGVMEATYNGEIEWRDPSPMVRQCFYRVRSVYPESPLKKL
jgi:hypothetical protein